MSLTDTFAGLALDSQDSSDQPLLKLDPQAISDNLHSYLQTIIQNHLKPPSGLQPPASDPSTLSLEGLHSRVRLYNEDGVEFVAPSMPAGEELLYRCSITAHFLNHLEIISEEELHVPELRDELVGWVLRLYGRSKFKLETLHLAVRTLDRFLARRNLPVELYKTLGATTLWMAAKFEESYFSNRMAQWFLLLEGILPADLFEMEYEVLSCFDFNIAVPNTFSFFEVAATYMPMRRRTLSLCQYLLELSLLECKYLRHGANLLAAAVLYLAVHMLDPYNWNEVPIWLIQVIVEALKVKLTEVKACARELLATMQLNQTCPEDFTCRRFAKGRRYRVSQIKF